MYCQMWLQKLLSSNQSLVLENHILKLRLNKEHAARQKEVSNYQEHKNKCTRKLKEEQDTIDKELLDHNIQDKEPAPIKDETELQDKNKQSSKTTAVGVQEKNEQSSKTAATEVQEKNERVPKTTATEVQDKNEQVPKTAATEVQDKELASKTVATEVQDKTEQVPKTATTEVQDKEQAHKTATTDVQNKNEQASKIAATEVQHNEQTSEIAPTENQYKNEQIPKTAATEFQDKNEQTSTAMSFDDPVVLDLSFLPFEDACRVKTDLDKALKDYFGFKPRLHVVFEQRTMLPPSGEPIAPIEIEPLREPRLELPNPEKVNLVDASTETTHPVFEQLCRGVKFPHYCNRSMYLKIQILTTDGFDRATILGYLTENPYLTVLDVIVKILKDKSTKDMGCGKYYMDRPIYL